MGGLVFGAIAALWLVYLLPYLLGRREHPLLEEHEAELPFSTAVTIVRRGTSLADAEPGTAVVTTPLTRRAALRELTQIDHRAASRRRRVLLSLLIVLVVVTGFALVGLGAWWTPAIPLGLIVVFAVVARFSVRVMRRDLAARAERIRAAVDEETVAIAILDTGAEDSESIDISAPVARPASLWDPVPITAATYVSKPLAPRTVRTIDLSTPVSPTHAWPVIADAPESTSADQERGDQAAG